MTQVDYYHTTTHKYKIHPQPMLSIFTTCIKPAILTGPQRPRPPAPRTAQCHSDPLPMQPGSPGEFHAWLDSHWLHKQTCCVKLSRKANMADIQNALASDCAHNQQLSFSEGAYSWHKVRLPKAQHPLIKNQTFPTAAGFSSPAVMELMNMRTGIDRHISSSLQ